MVKKEISIDLTRLPLWNLKTGKNFPLLKFDNFLYAEDICYETIQFHRRRNTNANFVLTEVGIALGVNLFYLL